MDHKFCNVHILVMCDIRNIKLKFITLIASPNTYLWMHVIQALSARLLYADVEWSLWYRFGIDWSYFLRGSYHFPCKFTDSICKGTWDFSAEDSVYCTSPQVLLKMTTNDARITWRTGFLRYNLTIHNNGTEFMKTSGNISWVLQEVEHRALTEFSVSWYSGIHGNLENPQTTPSLFNFLKSHYINNSSWSLVASEDV